VKARHPDCLHLDAFVLASLRLSFSKVALHGIHELHASDSWQARCRGLLISGLPSSPSLLQAFDATANPYIGLAAVMVAGLDGIRLGLKLPEPLAVDPGGQVQPGLDKWAPLCFPCLPLRKSGAACNAVCLSVQKYRFLVLGVRSCFGAAR
jgi:hypothetical protein